MDYTLYMGDMDVSSSCSRRKLEPCKHRTVQITCLKLEPSRHRTVQPQVQISRLSKHRTVCRHGTIQVHMYLHDACYECKSIGMNQNVVTLDHNILWCVMHNRCHHHRHAPTRHRRPTAEAAASTQTAVVIHVHDLVAHHSTS